MYVYLYTNIHSTQNINTHKTLIDMDIKRFQHACHDMNTSNKMTEKARSQAASAIGHKSVKFGPIFNWKKKSECTFYNQVSFQCAGLDHVTQDSANEKRCYISDVFSDWLVPWWHNLREHIENWLRDPVCQHGLTSMSTWTRNHILSVDKGDLSIPKLQWCTRWSLGMDKQFHPTLHNGCIYSSMLGLMLSHVSERSPLLEHSTVVNQRKLYYRAIKYSDSHIDDAAKTLCKVLGLCS